MTEIVILTQTLKSTVIPDFIFLFQNQHHHLRRHFRLPHQPSPGCLIYSFLTLFCVLTCPVFSFNKKPHVCIPRVDVCPLFDLICHTMVKTAHNGRFRSISSFLLPHLHLHSFSSPPSPSPASRLKSQPRGLNPSPEALDLIIMIFYSSRRQFIQHHTYSTILHKNKRKKKKKSNRDGIKIGCKRVN